MTKDSKGHGSNKVTHSGGGTFGKSMWHGMGGNYSHLDSPATKAMNQPNLMYPKKKPKKPKTK